jgi:enolase
MAKLVNHPITSISAEEIKDSRGNFTLKVSVFAGGVSGSFSVPSGASTGVHEVHELRDPVPEQARYGAGVRIGGVRNAIDKVNSVIAPALVGKNVCDQAGIDDILVKLDGTPNKKNLGGNSMVGVSIACAKAAARATDRDVCEYLRTLTAIKPSRKMPYLYMNLINGGKHAKNDLAFQEYHLVPDTEDPAEAVDIGIKVQESLRGIISGELGEESVVLGDEGGFAPKTDDIRKPLLYLTQAIKENNLEGKVRLALDVAASSFFVSSSADDSGYKIGSKIISSRELMDLYASLISEFGIFSIEDPFNEEDFENFGLLSRDHKELKVVGDDLTVTSSQRLKEALKPKNSSVNAIIIKPNQIGTLSETLETMKMARENGVELIISHRSGETDDDFIADLAYAFGCFGLKAGSPLKPERMVKYERLIAILDKEKQYE